MQHWQEHKKRKSVIKIEDKNRNIFSQEKETKLIKDYVYVCDMSQDNDDRGS